MKWRRVPTNIFCGPKAWAGFLEDWNSRAVIQTDADDVWAMAVYHEMNIARLYIGYKSMPSKKAQMNTLSKVRIWYMKVCQGYIGGDVDVGKEVLSLLNMTHSTNARSYEELADILCQR